REYFASPENILKNEINNTTDIYSLGMVMYRLFNFNRFPFLPSKDESYAISEYADEKAYQRRISGENPASPTYASENTAEIICKCCRYEKEERYKKAAEVAEAIDNAMKTENLTDVLDYPSFSAYGSKTEIVEKEEHNVPIPEDKGPKSINVEPEKKQDTEVENENIYTMGAQAYYTEAMGSIKNNRQVDIDGESLQNIDEVSKKIAEKYGYESKEFRKFTEKLRILEDVKENNEILKKDNKKRALTIKILCGVACAAIIVGIVFLLNTDTYYINQGQFDRIYKKNLIGTTECFKEVPAENLIKKSKYLYYINQEDRKLYKSSIKNGTDEEVLSEDAVTVFRIKDDYIYYLNTGDDDKLYRMETDGTDVSCVYDKRCASISLEDGNIEIVPADNPSDLLILNTKDLSVKEALVD
ncbi:MAG: DUF5050 domain-containing protein, partial [Oscillospiraceae bacterium]|nr:DUF5050 domain-containing protein [Oscillospiraceae bacterium]